MLRTVALGAIAVLLFAAASDACDNTTNGSGAGGSSVATAGSGGCDPWATNAEGGGSYACGSNSCKLGQEVCVETEMDGCGGPPTPSYQFECRPITLPCASDCPTLAAASCGMVGSTACAGCAHYGPECIIDCGES